MRKTRHIPKLTAAVLALGLIAAACGGGDDKSSSATTAKGSTGVTGGAATTAANATPSDVDPNGILRIGWELTTQTPSLDPIKVGPSSPATGPFFAVYDSLLRRNAAGDYLPGLAKTVTVVDGSTITVELQPNIMFSDGTPLDATAAKFSIERNRDSKNTVLSAELQQIKTITVDSPVKFTMALTTPVAGSIYALMPYGDFLIVSPTAVKNGVDLSKNPVGAGPFVVDSLDVNRSYKFKKNPTYFQAAKIRLAGIEWVNLGFGPPTINALRGKAIDAAELVTYDVGKELDGSGIKVTFTPSDSVMLNASWCKSRAPLDDVRVRQALNYAVDRDAMNKVLYGGQAEPMWGFFAKASPFHNPAVDDMYKYDPVKAKDLLKQAGKETLNLTAMFVAGQGDRAAEMLQAQWKAVGVNLTLKPFVSAEFFPDAKGADIFFYALERTGIQKVARILVPGSIGNVCNWNNAELNAQVDKIKSVQPDSPDAVAAWKQLQQVSMSQAMLLQGLFAVRATAWNDSRIGNVSHFPAFNGRPSIDFYDAYMKK